MVVDVISDSIIGDQGPYDSDSIIVLNDLLYHGIMTPLCGGAVTEQFREQV